MRHLLTISILLLLPLFLLCGCENDTSNDLGTDDGGPPVEGKTCIGCHSSRENLELALGGKTEASKVSIPNKGDG